MDQQWVDLIDRTVDKVFDGELYEPSNKLEKSAIKLSATVGDRTQTKILMLTQFMDELSEQEQSDAMFSLQQGDMKYFMQIVWPHLLPETRIQIDNLGTAGSWGSGDDLIEWYASAMELVPDTTRPVDGLLVGDMGHINGYFHGEGNLATIAPAGSGKGQCLVIPNLLMYFGGAFVLDIKGENYNHAHEARAKMTEKYGNPEDGEVLPGVLKFAPGEEGSACWNPLDFIRTTPSGLWEDSRALAGLLIVPTAGDYFEERGQDLLSAIIQLVVLSGEREANMREVWRILSSTHQGLQYIWDEMVTTGNETLIEAAQSFQSTADKEFSGVINSVRRSLSIWSSPSVTAVTSETTEGFNPAYLRKGGSVFVSIPAGKVEMYASVLRVLIGQNIYGIMEDRENIAELPITFFLDEFPQLGYMKVFEDAADVGRDTKIRLWLFCQNLGQLKERYKNWEGLLSSCIFQTFMNINDHETASYVASRLGESSGTILDKSKKQMASVGDLLGPKFKDDLLVLSRNMKPFKAAKIWLSEIDVLISQLPDDMKPKYWTLEQYNAFLEQKMHAQFIEKHGEETAARLLGKI